MGGQFTLYPQKNMERYQESNFKEYISRKIGIKLLDFLQIQSIMPDFMELLKAISIQRERASGSGQYMTANYHLMHDNIFGILGGRGSGKTSVLFSLREYLMKENQNDIILPIISPELISEGCSMLSWVLSMFQETVYNMEKCIRQQPDVLHEVEKRYPSRKHDCYTFDDFDLRQEYDDILQECGTLRGLQDIQPYEYEDMISLRAQHSQRQYHLMNRLSQFWEKLAFVQQKITRQEHTPLIFIMFDDIDLAPERSMELLLSAYKYFSSPYVVIVLTAAMNTLRQVLTYRMYEKVVGSKYTSLIQGHDILAGYSSSGMVDVYQMSRANDAALEYLNKVIPQTSRYELSRYDTYDRKLLFRYPKKERLVPYDIYTENSIPLGKFVLLCLEENQLLCPDYGTGNAQRNFLASPYQDDQLAREYYMLFGDKNRYICNACLGIFQACEQLREIRTRMKNAGANCGPEYIRDIYYVLRHLLTVLITSHTRSLEECSRWIPDLLKYTYGTHFLFINYSFLLEQYSIWLHAAEEDVAKELSGCEKAMTPQSYEARYADCLKEQHIQIKKKIGILFLMLNFLEHLTSVVAPEYYNTIGQPGRVRSIHGLPQILEFINYSALYDNQESNFMLFPQVESMDDAMEFYGDILAEPERFLHFDITNSTHVADYFWYMNQHPRWMNMLSDETTDQMPVSHLYTSCTRNSAWIRTVCSMLYLTKSGIQLMYEGVFKEYIAFFDSLSLLPGLTKQRTNCCKSIQKILQDWNIQEQAEKSLQYLWSLKGAKKYRRRNLKKESENITDWNELCEVVLENPDETFLLYNFIKKIESENQLPVQNNSALFCAKVEQLLIGDNSILTQLPVIAKFRKEDRADIMLGITSLIDGMPDLNIFVHSLLEPIQNAPDTDEWLEVPIKSILSFLQRASMQLYVWDFSNESKKDAPSLGAYYRSYLQDLIDVLYVGFQEKDRGKLIQFLEHVSLLKALLPYYIYARFVLINAQQYSEFRVLSHKEQQENLVKGNDIAAQVYDRLCSIILTDKGDMQTLDEIMIGVKYQYSRQYMRQFGVIE